MTAHQWRKLGVAINAVDLETQATMAETVSTVLETSTIPRDAWRDFLLAFAIVEAHDQGAERTEVERAVAEIITEEWSTPNTTGRVAQANARENRRRN